MRQPALFDRYLLARPTVRMVVEWPIIIGTGILGLVFHWARIPFFPYSNLAGAAIMAAAWVFHQFSHRAHHHGHEQSEQIEGLVTTGVFSHVRHPMYLSLILMYLGLAIAWGVVWMLVPAILFSVVTVLVAVKEEEYLLQRFGRAYEEYMRSVPWRLLPGVF